MLLIIDIRPLSVCGSHRELVIGVVSDSFRDKGFVKGHVDIDRFLLIVIGTQAAKLRLCRRHVKRPG